MPMTFELSYGLPYQALHRHCVCIICTCMFIHGTYIHTCLSVKYRCLSVNYMSDDVDLGTVFENLPKWLCILTW